MKLLRLKAAFHRTHFGQDRMHQSAGIEQIPAPHALRRQKNAHELFTDALGADLVDRRGIRYERVPGLMVDLITERRRETHRAQHSKAVLHESLRGLAD